MIATKLSTVKTLYLWSTTAVELSDPVTQTICPAVVAADFALEIEREREIRPLDLSVPDSIVWVIGTIVCVLQAIVVKEAHLCCCSSHILRLSRRVSFCVVSVAGLTFSLEYCYAQILL